MDIKQLIRKVKSDPNLLVLKQEELARLESICMLQGVAYDKQPSQPKPNSKEASYLTLIDAREKLEKFKEQILIDRRELTELINKLTDPLMIEVMYMYCLENASIKAIAKRKNYSHQNIYHIYQKAILELEQIRTN